MLMTLCETGTRGLIAAVFGSASKGETDYAHDLVSHLTTDMLLLADRAVGVRVFVLSHVRVNVLSC